MKKTVLILSILLMSPAFSIANDWKIGMFSSPDGFGVSSDWSRKGKEFSSATVYLDCYDILFEDSNNIGVVCNFVNCFIIKRWNTNNLSTYLYWGPGASAGYVRDNGEKYPGIMLGVSGAIGSRFVFKRGVSIDLSFGATLGVHLNIHPTDGNPVLDIYKRGLSHIPFPRIKIEFPLK